MSAQAMGLDEADEPTKVYTPAKVLEAVTRAHSLLHDKSVGTEMRLQLLNRLDAFDAQVMDLFKIICDETEPNGTKEHWGIK